jgi:hypothetical protein
MKKPTMPELATGYSQVFLQARVKFLTRNYIIIPQPVYSAPAPSKLTVSSSKQAEIILLRSDV